MNHNEVNYVTAAQYLFQNMDLETGLSQAHRYQKTLLCSETMNSPHSCDVSLLRLKIVDLPRYEQPHKQYDYINRNNVTTTKSTAVSTNFLEITIESPPLPPPSTHTHQRKRSTSTYSINSIYTYTAESNKVDFITCTSSVRRQVVTLAIYSAHRNNSLHRFSHTN